MNYEGFKNYIFDRLWSELPDNLFYHGVHHTSAVKDAVKLIANHESVTPEQLVILKSAALCHDYGFVFRYRDNESIACEESRKILPRFSYSDGDIDILCGLIMATGFPQTPQTPLEEILCDADLYYLGTDQFSEISETLRNELKSVGTCFTDKEWIEFQLNFMEVHHYFTDYAHKKLKKTKQSNIVELQKELENYK